MRQEAKQQLQKISLRLKEYPDDPKNTLIHFAYINRALAEMYEDEMGVTVKDKIPVWAKQDFGVELTCANDLKILRNAIMDRYAGRFTISSDRLGRTNWERYWVNLKIRKELKQ